MGLVRFVSRPIEIYNYFFFMFAFLIFFFFFLGQISYFSSSNSSKLCAVISSICKVNLTQNI